MTMLFFLLCIICALVIFFLVRLLLRRDCAEQHMVNFNKPVIEKAGDNETKDEQVTNWAHWEYHTHE